LAGGLLVLVTLVAYIPAIRGGFIWDDDDYVTENPVLNHRGGFQALWLIPSSVPQYYPLVFSSFWLEYRMWGLWAGGYHLTNVVLHGLSAVVLWRLLRRLGLRGAYLAGLLFALHPVHVESVAWVTERKNVLSGLFYLSAAWAYLRCWPLGMERGGRPFRWGYYALSLFVFACALLSKTVTGSLPAALVLLIWWRRGRWGRGEWLEVIRLVLFFVVGMGMGLMTAWLERHQVGAEGEDWSLTAVERFLVAGRAMWFYAWKLVYPGTLMFVYPRWSVSQGVWWQYLYPVGAAVVVLSLWLLGGRIGRGWLAGVLFFVGTLFPALGFLNVYPHRFSFVADHFQYLASLGLLVPAGVGLWSLVERCPARLRTVGIIGLAVLLATLGVKTWCQGWVYKDMMTLWADSVQKNPNSFLAQNNLGNLYEKQGKHEQAAACYRQTIRLKPGFAEGYYNLAGVLELMGKVDEAIANYHKALECKADLAQAYYNLGIIMGKQDNYDAASGYYRKAIEAQPDHSGAHNNLGLVLLKQGKFEEALASLATAVRLKPDMPQAHCNAGIALERLGRADEAAVCFKKALELYGNNADAHRKLGDNFADLAKYEGAADQYAEALRIGPETVNLHYKYATVLHWIGRIEEAVSQYERALAMDPNFAEAHNDLGIVFMGGKRLEEARGQFTEALRLDPNYAEAENNLGVVFQIAGKDEEALPHHLRAVALNPDYSQAHYNAALVMMRQGRREQAISHLREALRTDPSNADAQSALENLENKKP
jgi:tetratricopeptide (TPR) repeat protein